MVTYVNGNTDLIRHVRFRNTCTSEIDMQLYYHPTKNPLLCDNSQYEFPLNLNYPWLILKTILTISI